MLDAQARGDKVASDKWAGMFYQLSGGHQSYITAADRGKVMSKVMQQRGVNRLVELDNKIRSYSAPRKGNR